MLPPWPASAPLLCAMGGLTFGKLFCDVTGWLPGKSFSFGVFVMTIGLVAGIWIRDRKPRR